VAILGTIGFIGLVSFSLTRALRRRRLALRPRAAQG
jgi:ABC-type Fe3+-siderophore transport system permease subunit